MQGDEVLRWPTRAQLRKHRIGNIEIKSQADRFQGWTLTVDRRFGPTGQDWETVEKIADYILSSTRFNRTSGQM
jgi:hypothetical protein